MTDNNDGPVTREEARERVKGWYDREEHRKPKPGKQEPREDPLPEEGED